MNEIKERLAPYEALLPVGKFVTPDEASRRAGEFLVAAATVADFRHIFSEEKIKYTTVQSAVYAELLSQCTGKTVTENKLTVEAAPDYATARENLERIDNDLAYLKAFYEIFNNAHIFYRNLSKENP